MQLRDLIALASKGYSDEDLVLDYHDGKFSPVEPQPDTLALYIARDIADTFDESMTDDQQAAEARRVLETAIDDLRRVIDAI